MRSHHICQELECAPPLVHNIHELVLRSNTTNDDLVFPTSQTFVRFITELSERHAQRPSFFLAHIVVQFRLHGWWGDFKDLGVRSRVGELFAEA